MAIPPRHSRTVLVESLRKLLRRNAAGNIVNLLSKIRPGDVPALFKELTEREKPAVFQAVAGRDPGLAAAILPEFHVEPGLAYLEHLQPPVQVTVLKAMTPDDAAEFLSERTEDQRESLLESMQGREAREVRYLLEYGEETAGRIMSPAFFAVQETLTAGEAVTALQSRGDDVEVPFYVYVLDQRRHLVGVLSLRQLLLAARDTPVREFMATDIVSVTAETDQEEVARVVSRYDFLAVPVVDDQHRLVGVIAIDEVIDVLKEEATEDVYRLAGTSEDERISKSILRAVVLRIPWLLAAFFGGLLASRVINHFQGVLAQMVVLAGFIPVILGMGGNIGTQCSTTIVRGLATGRIEVREMWAVLFREVRIALILGLLYGGLLALTSWLVLDIPSDLGALVGFSLLCSMLIAATIGSLVPMVLRRMGVDPAVATGPFITTSVDILATLVFFQLATRLVLT
ncbi:MAG: magnesium transporter [Acidobacteriota bacterium]